MTAAAGWDIFAGGPAVAVMTPDEAETVAAAVHAARDAWTERRPFAAQHHTFHTLGAATYLDPPAAYAAGAASTGPLLRARFGDLLARVCNAVEAATGAPVQLADGLAPPGFHIYRGNSAAPTGLRFGGTVHVDTPHRRHAFAFPVAATLSFTLPVALPRAGGGMFWWRDVPSDLLQASALPLAMAPDAFAWFDVHKRHLAYKAGAMVLHDGTMVHQVANDRPTADDEWRITLQGHGVRGGGAWHIYF